MIAELTRHRHADAYRQAIKDGTPRCYDCGDVLTAAPKLTIHNFRIDWLPVRICYACWLNRGCGANQERRP